MNLADHWFDRAYESKDPYDRFIYAYIAFNYFYNEIHQKGERNRVALYAEEKCKEFRVNPFSIDVSEYKNAPVKDMKHPESVWVVKDSDVASLFNAIYQVRCNLFHGNKCLGDPRDKNLVSQGAEVLIMLLSRILNRNGSSGELAKT